MRRRDFGTWGANLPLDQLSKAVTGGVMLAAQPAFPVSDSVPLFTNFLLEILKHPRTKSGAVPALLDPHAVGRWPKAEVLAQAWSDAYHGYIDEEWRPIRFELRGWQRYDPTWLLNLLFEKYRVTIGVSSVFLCSPAGEYNWSWHLPLRIGFLHDEESQRYRRIVEDQRFWPWLSRFVDVRAGQECCDLLILPHSLQAGLAEILRTPFRESASFVFLVGGGSDPFFKQRTLFLALREHLGAAGIGVQKVPEEKLVDWFNMFLQETSHNQSLDHALFSAAEVFGGTAPVLISDPKFLYEARNSRVLEALARRIRDGTATQGEMYIPSGLLEQIDPERRLELSPGGILPRNQYTLFAEMLEERSSRLGWAGETEDARSISELAYEAERVELEPVGDLRSIQSKVFDLKDPKSPVLEKRALQPGRAYNILIRIAPPDIEWPITAPTSFPDEDLDFSWGEVKLTVVLIEPDLSSEPQVGSLILPQRGASSECSFTVHVPDGIDGFQARIAVVYRNRILQTVKLQGQVTNEPDSLAEEDWIKINIDSVVRPGFTDLESRRHFDAALVLNHTAGEVSGAAAIMDDQVKWIRTDPFKQTITNIRDKLSKMEDEILDNAEAYSEFIADDTEELLRYLALHGSILYDKIIADLELHNLEKAKRVQIVSAEADRFLPVEFFYDHEAPEFTAKICAHALEALEKGSCANPCPEPQRSFICPLGFWCLSRVIERHAFDVEQTAKARGDYALHAEPFEGRKILKPLKSAVFGASEKVDRKVPGQRRAVVQTLNNVLSGGTEESETWDEWVADVAKMQPSLLVLLPHTFMDRQHDLIAMEIGKNAKLLARHIRDEHVRPSKYTRPPIVLLLGCETGDPNLSYDNFVAPFRRKKAAIVVTTLSTVLGRHAAPIAMALVKEMGAAIEQVSRPLGDVMLSVRRRLLAAGMSAVLTLAVYGDADWILEAC